MKISVSQILSATVEAMKSRFGGLLGLWATFFAISLAALLFAGFFIGGSSLAMMGAAGAGEKLAAGLGAGMILMLIVLYVGYILLACAQYGAMNAMASPLLRASFGEAFSTGWRSSLTLLGVMIILIVGYFIAALVFGLLTAALGALGEGGALVGTVVLIGAVLYFACRLLIVFPIVPVEGQRNPINAIARSWSLTRGNALAIFLSLIVLGIVFAIFLAIVLVPTFGTLTSLSEGDAAPGIAAIGFLGIGLLAFSAFFAIAYAAYLSAIHALLSDVSGQGLSQTFE